MGSPTNRQPPSDTDQQTVSVQRWRSLFVVIPISLALIVLVSFVVAPLLWGANKPLVLPLDDVYIHFQYARQIAEGQVYVYNPGLEPSSGATSLLYPYLLAIGYRLGFTDLALGWWAILIGTLALAGSSGLIMRLGMRAGLTIRAGVILTATFAFTGVVGWHFMSGMESGLLVFFMLLTLHALIIKHYPTAVMGAVLMAITRPEGAIMAVIAVPVMGIVFWGSVSRWQRVTFIAPLAALGIQPLVNLIFTGQAQAAGSSAKSILSMVPPEFDVIAGRVVANYVRLWWELLTGFSPREGLYLPVPLLVVALIGVIAIMVRDRRWWIGLMVTGWLVVGTAAVATLDPAFWHFKRYQVPFMALLFALAGWGLAWLYRHSRMAGWGTQIVLLVSAVVSGALIFQPAYQLNISYLHQQQIPMAEWLRENTPSDAVVAVHDVGLMRYLGDRTTVDMVGLTTNGAADSWRNGPGALAEFMAAYEPQPQYVASYTDALGLSYLVNTGLYGETLAEFPVAISERYNVALAGAHQGVWRIDWSAIEQRDRPQQPYYRDWVQSLRLTDTLNVANLDDERSHAYQWGNIERIPGFPTEVYEMDYVSCDAVCRVLDGGRRINGYEQFTLAAQPNSDGLLLTRIHPAHMGSFDVYINGEYLSTRTIPAIPGQWLEIGTRIPAEWVTDPLNVRIEPHTPGGHYMPYTHWLYQGAINVEAAQTVLADFGTFTLTDVATAIIDDQLRVELGWHLPEALTERADYRLFVHLYDDLNVPPVAQADRYPLDGATPIGNWLSGAPHDTIMVDLSAVEPESLMLVIGFYDPTTGDRLIATSDRLQALADGRLIVDEIEVD